MNFNREFFQETKLVYSIYKQDRTKQIGGGFTYEIKKTNNTEKFTEMQFQFSRSNETTILKI